MNKPKLLVLTGGPNHDFAHAQRRLVELLSPRFECVATTAVRDLDKLHVEEYAGAVIFTCEKLGEPMGIFQTVNKFVEQGGGLVLIHAAITSFADQPAWKTLIGAQMDGGKLGVKYPLKWDDAKHPVVAGVEAWEIEDEHYQLSAAAPGCEVFASSLWEGARYAFGYERTVGKGKIVALAAGHRTQTLDDARYGKMILQAAEYVAKE